MRPSHSLAPLLASLACSLLPSPARAQGPVWSRELDGAFGGEDGVGRVAVSDLGEVFVAGYTTAAPHASSPLPQKDALIVKYDALGQLRWQRQIDLGENEVGWWIRRDPASGALYVVGWVERLTPTAVRPWLVWRIDPASGAVLWQRDYIDDAHLGGFPSHVVLDAGGGVVAAGLIAQQDGTTETATNDVAIVRWAPDGTRSWAWTRPSPVGVRPRVVDIAADPAGGVVFALATTPSPTPGPWTLRRLDAAGNESWSVAAPSGRYFTGVAVDSASEVLSLVTLSGSTRPTVLEKRDSGGSLLWSRAASEVLGPERAFWRLAVGAGDDIFVVGDADDSIGIGVSTELARLDASGHVLWTAPRPEAELAGIDAPIGDPIVAPNGDVLLLSWCAYPNSSTRFAHVARFDARGDALWAQGIRALEGRSVEPRALAAAPHGGAAVAGVVPLPGPQGQLDDVIVVSLREQSRSFCAGDGSAAPCPCGNDAPAGSGGGCLDGDGRSARLDDLGVASLSTDTLRFRAVRVSGLTVLVQGSTSTAPAPFGSGLSCVGGTLRRLYVAQATPGLVVDVPAAGQPIASARSAMIGDPLAPGARRAYQALYRGAAPACAGGGAQLSNAVEITWLP